MATHLVTQIRCRSAHVTGVVAWAAAMLIFAVPGLSGCTRPAESFSAIDITGAHYAQGFSLPDAAGRMRTLADFKGQVVVVFFGYTQCPDVCPKIGRAHV